METVDLIILIVSLVVIVLNLLILASHHNQGVQGISHGGGRELTREEKERLRELGEQSCSGEVIIAGWKFDDSITYGDIELKREDKDGL